MNGMPEALNIELSPLEHKLLVFMRQSRSFTTKQNLLKHFPDRHALNEALRNLKDKYLVDHRPHDGHRECAYRPRRNQGWELLAGCMGLDQMPKLEGSVRRHRLEA